MAAGRLPIRDMTRKCAFCGGPLPPDARGGRKYCSRECKARADNSICAVRTSRRRAEETARRRAAEGRTLHDPWDKNDLFDFGMENILRMAALDPAPFTEADDAIGGPLASTPDIFREGMRALQIRR